MFGNLVRAVGILGLLYHGEIEVASSCIVALIVAALLDEGSSIRFAIGIIVLIIGLGVIFHIQYIAGIIVTILCTIAALSAPPAQRSS